MKENPYERPIEPSTPAKQVLEEFANTLRHSMASIEGSVDILGEAITPETAAAVRQHIYSHLNRVKSLIDEVRIYIASQSEC